MLVTTLRPSESVETADSSARKSSKVEQVVVPRSRRSLSTVLGLLWLLDGALQLQPFMFTRGFARQILDPAAAGQPFFVAEPVHWNAALIALHPALCNGAFAGVQIGLGIGLLYRPTIRVAIGASMVWAAGVWYLGEGLGGLAGGHTTALVGAPGAAVLYIILALAAWPSSKGPSVPPSRKAARRWTVRTWAALWIGFAILNLLPGNISPSTTVDQLQANASTVPHWLGSIDGWLAGEVRGLGAGATVLLVGIELAIGVLVLGRGRLRTVALVSGIAVTMLFWAVGQSFGQLLGGQATDPSTGPLMVVLGVVALGSRDPEVHSEASDLGSIVYTEGQTLATSSMGETEPRRMARLRL